MRNDAAVPRLRHSGAWSTVQRATIRGAVVAAVAVVPFDELVHGADRRHGRRLHLEPQAQAEAQEQDNHVGEYTSQIKHQRSLGANQIAVKAAARSC